MMWPQLTYIFLTVLGLGIVMTKHGEPRPPVNVWSHAAGVIVGFTLLYFGGFFTALGVAP